MKQTVTRFAFLLLAAVASGSAVSADVVDVYGVQRLQFKLALETLEQRQPLSEDTPDLTQYPLYPYLVALQLRQSLEVLGTDNDAAIADFLKAYAGQPVTRALQRDWWNNLAQREQWPRLLAEMPATVSDPGLQCARLTGLLKTGSGEELREDVLKLWLSGESRPQACTYPFDWLRSLGAQTDELRARRARLALDAGNTDLADMMIATLPESAATASLRREARLQRDPVAELPTLVTAPDLGVPTSSVLAAWSQMTRKQPQQAEAIFDKLMAAQQVSLARAAEFTRQLAVGFALSRDARALDYFLDTAESAQNESGFEWRVRAALWNGDWQRARDWIERMPAELRTQPRWRYWLARSYEMTDRASDAPAVYLGLLDTNNYYAVLAATRMQAPLLPRPLPAPPADPSVQTQLANNAALVRSRELFLVGRSELARSEWNYALDGADKALYAQAAWLASSWDWHLQAIATSTRAGVFDDFELLYPEPYQPQVAAAGKLANLPTPWIYAVMRQESLYDPRATSKRDAFGLLQLLLPTAQTTARRWKMPVPLSRDDLYLPENNALLGAAHLRDMTDRFGGRYLLALAAYNAGPNAVQRWLPAQPMDADVWVENIPFNETRNYVQKILWNVAVFGWRETREPQDLSALLQPVSTPAPVVAP